MWWSFWARARDLLLLAKDEGLACNPPDADITPLGGWPRTDRSPTRSGPEGSSRNEAGLGRRFSLPPFPGAFPGGRLSWWEASKGGRWAGRAAGNGPSPARVLEGGQDRRDRPGARWRFTPFAGVGAQVRAANLRRSDGSGT